MNTIKIDKKAYSWWLTAAAAVWNWKTLTQLL